MTILLGLHMMLVIGFTVRILLREDLSPPARLAWFIVLNVMPFMGTVLYFLFGEVDLGHKANKRHDQIFSQIRTYASDQMGHPKSEDRLIDPLYRPAFSYAASVNGFHPVAGNRAELMEDPQETITQLIADIDAATDHVHVLFYIWLDDGAGTLIAEALIRAAERGVTCRALADGMGSRRFIRSALWTRMRDAGVLLAVAMPLNNILMTLLTSRIDLRNHRKIIVIDGKISYCGSRNAADPEFRVKPKYAPWVDIMLRFEGPIVAQNALLFLSDWMQATGADFEHFPCAAAPVEGGFPAQVVGDGPTERRGATPQLFANLIACAQKELTLSTPYFVPDSTVFEALCSAAHRGVHVQLIFPENNDSWVVAAASRSYYRRLLNAGCRIHEYRGGLLHAKSLTVDGRICLIGSSNLDLRSFDLNYENNILLQDKAITEAVFERQLTYIAQSDEIFIAHVLSWSRLRRIWNNVIATIGPVL